MSDVELVRELFEDFNRGDFDAAFGKLHEHVEWEGPPDTPDTGGPYHGHEGVAAGFRRFLGVWESLTVELEDVTEFEPGTVLAMTHWIGRSRGAGIEVDQRVSQLYELEGGRVRRLRQFRTREEALEAL